MEQNTNERPQPHLTLLKGRNETHLQKLIEDGIKVDAVVMDPPYCSGGSTTAARFLAKIREILKNALDVLEFRFIIYFILSANRQKTRKEIK